MINPISGVSADVFRLQPPTAATPSQGTASFQEMFASIASNARDTMKAGEAASIAGIAGDASVQDVVQAMMSAEQQLRAAIAVRDRVVAAYQEVARMQI